MLKDIPSWLRTPPKTYTRPSPAKIPVGPTRDELLAVVKAAGHHDPEKMADSLLRNRENSLAIEKARHTTLQVATQPTAAVPAKKGRSIPSAPSRCKATNLNGKQCIFKRTGSTTFCTKHTVKKTFA